MGDIISIGTEIWRGGVNTWDCDEMGHMNVRVYVEKQLEGMVAFAHHLGMPEAFRVNAPVGADSNGAAFAARYDDSTTPAAPQAVVFTTTPLVRKKCCGPN